MKSRKQPMRTLLWGFRGPSAAGATTAWTFYQIDKKWWLSHSKADSFRATTLAAGNERVAKLLPNPGRAAFPLEVKMPWVPAAVWLQWREADDPQTANADDADFEDATEVLAAAAASAPARKPAAAAAAVPQKAPAKAAKVTWAASAAAAAPAAVAPAAARRAASPRKSPLPLMDAGTAADPAAWSEKLLGLTLAHFNTPERRGAAVIKARAVLADVGGLEATQETALKGFESLFGGRRDDAKAALIWFLVANPAALERLLESDRPKPRSVALFDDFV